jgi:nitroimidazol reductase NimA-like FMN-containing flavoprotein (pyridoxamine 5'-phosphate oxidase superfamily)
MLGELNALQINNVLSSQAVGRLACTDGKKPYIVPVTYCYDGEFIYGQTNKGTKLTLLRKNPNVCFEVDVMTDMRNWQSVVVMGKFEELSRKEEEKARELFVSRLFPLSTSSTVHTYGHPGAAAGEEESNRVKPIMYRIRIARVSGRFEKP